jgi:hypothetical protein
MLVSDGFGRPKEASEAENDRSTGKKSMFSKITGLMGFIHERVEALIKSRLHDWFLTSVLALAGIAVASPTFARTVFDGDWTVLIVTHGGACDPAYRYGVQITNGTVVNDGSSAAAVQGRVTPAGAVKVTVRLGNQSADGSGRLSSNRGGGVWQGRSMSGSCSGTWEAERRK